MLKNIGGVSFVIGLILLFGIFYQKNYQNFLIGIVSGSVLIHIGLQLLK